MKARYLMLAALFGLSACGAADSGKWDGVVLSVFLVIVFLVVGFLEIRISNPDPEPVYEDAPTTEFDAVR